MLRPYQKKAIDLVRDEYAKGYSRVILQSPTGSGKSVIACEMIRKVLEKGKRAIFIVRGVSLVEQMSRRFLSEGIDHGVIQSNHWNYRPRERLQVCSADTMIARKNYPEAEFVVVDEAEQAASKGYIEILSKYPNSYILGITATPYSNKSLRHVGDVLVNPITMRELIDLGYLCDFRYFAPSTPDLSEVKISSSTKDYVSGQLETAMVKGKLTGQIIEHWIKLGENRPTLLFAVNIRHSKMLVEKFNLEGITAEHIDANTPQNIRDEVFERLKSGKTKIVSNVGIATRGFDAPFVSCLVLARPTKSLNLHIQILGRGSRISDGKLDCKILDHAGNISALGFPTEEHEVDLDGLDKKETTVKESKTCKNCFAVFRAAICPECGVVPPPAPTIILEETNEQLKELNAKDTIRIEHRRLLREGKKAGRKTGWAHHKIVNRFGYEACKEYLPEWFRNSYENKNKNVFAMSPFSPISRLQ